MTLVEAVLPLPYNPPTVDSSYNESSIVVQRYNRRKRQIKEKKDQQMRENMKALDEFRDQNHGRLPSLRYIMKLCKAGFPRAKEIIIQYARYRGVPVAEVKKLMTVRQEAQRKATDNETNNTKIPHVWIIDNGKPNNRKRVAISRKLNETLKSMICDILSCLESGNNQNADNLVMNLEIKLSEYASCVHQLQSKDKSTVFQCVFILGAIKRNFEYISKALIFFRDGQSGKIKESIFTKQEIDTQFKRFIPYIIQIYSNAAEILCKSEQFSDAQDICRMALSLMERSEIATTETIQSLRTFMENLLSTMKAKNLEKNIRISLTTVSLDNSDNSLCNAVGFLIYRQTGLGSKIKEYCVKFLKCAYERFKSCVENGDNICKFEQFCNKLGSNGFEGNSLILLALSEIYNRDIQIYKNTNMVQPSFTVNAPRSNSDNNHNHVPIRLKLEESSDIYSPIIDTNTFYANNVCLNANNIGQYEANKIDSHQLDVYQDKLSKAKSTTAKLPTAEEGTEDEDNQDIDLAN